VVFEEQPMNRFVVFVLSGLTATLVAQQPPPAFEVASVKQNVSGDTTYSYRAARGTLLEANRGDDVFAALPKQLGLRLEARTGPLEVPVIDSVEMPTPN
jgi:hypothetical protein